MDIKEYAKQRLEKSAHEAEVFWDAVKCRLSKDLIESEDCLQVIDIQEISDDCVDLIMLRKNQDATIDQLEHCRIVAESRWFRKPKISMHFSSGPFADEFFDEK